MKKLPTVSLIIPTCNWPGALELTLLSVQEQKQLPDKVIIAGYQSDNDTKKLIEQFESRLGIPLLHIEPVTGTLCRAAILNKSVEKSGTEYIVQVESGTILHPDVIRDHLQFARPMSFVTSSSALISERHSQAMLSDKKQRLPAWSGHLKHRLNALRLKPISRFFAKPGFDVSSWEGAMAAYWRQDFLKVNGYNKKINTRKQGEWELAARFANNEIAHIKLRFAALQFQLSQEKTLIKSGEDKTEAEDKTHLVESTISNKVKYCKSGLLDLSQKEAEERFIRSAQGKISATIITYNEEENIEKCIRSLTGVADEIIVVDSYSEDQTENICKRYPVTFIKNPFEGHIQQKQFALSLASHRYVLSLDADEYLSETLQSSICRVKDQLAYQGYSMNRRNFYRGKCINHAGWYPDNRVRLFNKEKARWGGQNPHDIIVMDNPDYTFHLKGDLYHNTLNSLEEHQRQTENYARIAADYKFEHGLNKNTAFLKMLFSPLSKFFTMYIMKLGFLDGSYGLRICYEEFKCTYKKYKLLADRYKMQGKSGP